MDSRNALQLAKMRNASQETRDHAFKMEAVRKNLMPPADKEKKLRESCEGFESIFIQKMWEQMRATIPESGLLKGREEKFWQSMYDQELAKTMAGAGGIGLADMMYEQLSLSLRSASKSTADAVGGQPPGFASELAPAPLLRGAVPVREQAAADAAETPARQPRPAALAGLYSEAGQPGVLPDAPRDAAPSQAPAQPAADGDVNPAILAALNELRAVRQTDVPAGGHHAGPKSVSLGARPPLPPMQGEGYSQTPDQQGRNHISTLTRPVHKPVSGKRTVLPRAASGPRVPAGQPVHRNLPAAQQETLQAQARNQIQNVHTAQNTPAGAIPGPAAGNNSIGAEALNAFAARQKAAQLAPDASLPGAAAAGTPGTGG
ncbi:MAG: rod-binding protein [Deltaproteobacteria bacterium]|jgi:Rod binding domain-containing protein|nr:rod-binding protein [Deltaproteobacteria bacterium]